MGMGDMEIEFNRLTHNTSQIKKMIFSLGLDFSHCNRRSELFGSNEVWQVCCRKLWTGLLHFRFSFVIWCLLNFYFYTNLRGPLQGIDPVCPKCNNGLESTKHMFHNCRRVKRKRAKAKSKSRGCAFDLSGDLSNYFTLATTGGWQGD